MVKKCLVLVLAALIVGVAFAQEDSEQTGSEQTNSEQTSSEQAVLEPTGFAAMAKNTIVVDLGPTIIGAAIGAIGDAVGGSEEGVSTSGFGIAVQYERQLFKKLSVAGRFAYLGGGVGYEDSYVENGSTLKTNAGIEMSSFSIEGHARFYPFGETFFLSGMLGYANMSVGFSGKMVGRVDGQEEAVKTNIEASQGFLKLGTKIGWRISFGKNGGFTFEPAFGYSYGFGLGDTIGKQLSREVKRKTGAEIDEDSFDEVFDIIENFIFVGGPRMTLAFGYRF